MATIYRSLLLSTLLVFAYALSTGVTAGAGPEELTWHLRVGLVATLLAVLVQSVPFAYFLGTGFWIKAFVKASSADATWEARHAEWMKGRGYKVMYVAAALPAAAAIAGGLFETGRIAAWWHPTLMGLAIVATIGAWLTIPSMMLRNSALMDELAATHRVPKPDTPEMDELVERAEADALPALFQLSRVLMYAGFNVLALWLYLRFGTEGYRDVPFLPFGLLFAAAITVGMALNARHDPEKPSSAQAAWLRAGAVGSVILAAVLWLGI